MLGLLAILLCSCSDMQCVDVDHLTLSSPQRELFLVEGETVILPISIKSSVEERIVYSRNISRNLLINSSSGVSRYIYDDDAPRLGNRTESVLIDEGEPLILEVPFILTQLEGQPAIRVAGQRAVILEGYPDELYIRIGFRFPITSPTCSSLYLDAIEVKLHLSYG